jgi:hypothetical protein
VERQYTFARYRSLDALSIVPAKPIEATDVSLCPYAFGKLWEEAIDCRQTKTRGDALTEGGHALRRILANAL